MKKILVFFILSSLILLSSCVWKNNEDISAEENKSFDSPALLQIEDNTPLTEIGLWDE
jgi:hypothetical protein